MSRRAAAVIVLAAIAVPLVALIRSYNYVPVLNDGAPNVHNAAELPDRIHVCGRIYGHHGVGAQWTLSHVKEITDNPAFVNPWIFAACPRYGYFEDGGERIVTTVMFVRVGEDAYDTYALSGGP
jgi:hypothetical protein